MWGWFLSLQASVLCRCEAAKEGPIALPQRAWFKPMVRSSCVTVYSSPHTREQKHIGPVYT